MFYFIQQKVQSTFSQILSQTGRKPQVLCLPQRLLEQFIKMFQLVNSELGLFIIKLMQALNQQQIKQAQLKLLETTGYSLADYTSGQNITPLFKELPFFTKVSELQRLKPSRVKSFGLSSNANLKGFALTLLASIYSNPVKQDMLSIIKSCLYNPGMDLTILKHSLLPQISNTQMKKLVVEFFFTLAYASYDDKIQDKLRKYPVIMDILVMFLRCLLVKSNMKNADDCLFKLPTQEMCELLIELLDVNCKLSNSIYLFYDDHIFLFENENQEVLVGNYHQYEGQRINVTHMKKTLKLSDLEEEIQEDTENQRSSRPSHSTHNRSLELRGIVSESIVFEPQALTPFFNFDADNNSSFQSNPDHQLSQVEIAVKKQKDSLMKGSKQMSLLKMMDRSMHHNQANGGLGNMIRSKIIENQLKESADYRENIGAMMDRIMDSPITPIASDSPHTLFSQGNFASIRAQLQLQQQVKIMKKSKSQSANRMSQDLGINGEESQITPKNMKKKEKVEYATSPKNPKAPCVCVEGKKKQIKLCSNLYEINVRMVPARIEKRPIYNYNPNFDFSQGQIYISSKGLNFQTEILPYSHNTSLQYISHVDRKEKIHHNLDTSISSCYVLPRVYKDSETQSKRQYSPISHHGDRQVSPLSKSIGSPKVFFTYKNPLKQSAQFPNAMKKHNKK